MPAAFKKIVLLARAGTSPWFTLSKIAGIYVRNGYDARMIESAAEAGDADVLITHNINGLEENELKEVLGRNTRVVSFIDTPYNKTAVLEKVDARVAFVFTDGAYVNLAREINHHRNPMISHPLEISIQDNPAVKPLAQRKYDVMFAGRLVEFDSLKDYSNLEQRKARGILDKALHDSSHHIHELARDSFAFRKKVGLYRHSFTGEHFLGYCWRLSHTLRKERKLHVLKELETLKNSTRCCFISNNVDVIRKVMGDNHDYFDFMPWADVVEKMHDTRIVINTMPGHIDCLHEHMVEAMMSGAVCASDENQKTRRDLVAGEEFIGFDYTKGNLSGKIKQALGDLTAAQAIAQRGTVKIKAMVNDDEWLGLLDKLR